MLTHHYLHFTPYFRYAKPLEVWKSSVVLEHINSRESTDPPLPSSTILKNIVRQGGILSLWSGLSPRMIEGLFSGGVLLAAKETIHTVLDKYAAPMIAKSMGVTVPPSFIGFVAGAGGGAAQSLVMGPTSLIVTSCVAASKESDGEKVSAFQVAQKVLQERGIRGLYRGAPAVAMRQVSLELRGFDSACTVAHINFPLLPQATNWASRQGFTEFVRPRIPIEGVWGELIAGEACVVE